MHSDSFPGSTFHPSNGDHVTGPPSQETVDESGDDIHGETAGFTGANNPGHADVTNLPHPAPRPVTEGEPESSYDPIGLLDMIYLCYGAVERLNRQISLGEDEAIKRRMRGPLRDSVLFTPTADDGTYEATLTFGPVPSGEIWLLDRYIISTNFTIDPTTDTCICRVFDGSISDPTSMIDFTNNGVGDVSDDTQPVMLFPNSFLRFHWSTSFTEIDGTISAYARVNYRSIAENVQFAKGNADVI